MPLFFPLESCLTALSTSLPRLEIQFWYCEGASIRRACSFCVSPDSSPSPCFIAGCCKCDDLKVEGWYDLDPFIHHHQLCM